MIVGLGALMLAPSALALAPVPDVTNLPTISGSPEQGQTVACSSGGWTNTPTSYTYTWKSGITTVQTHTTAATSDSYTLQSSDVGQLVTCTVGASNSDGSSLLTMISAAVTTVALPTVSVPVLSAVPTISGSPEQGQQVSCSQGSWSNSPTSFASTWQRNGVDIAGATNSIYTLTNSDVGQAITCTVTAVNGLGSSVPAISPSVLPVGLPLVTVPILTAVPTISGSPEQGQAVTCSQGSWSNSPTSYAYSWQRTGASIPGANSSTYTLTSGDVTRAITCTVIAHNASGDSAPAISPPIIPVALPVTAVPIETVPPTISGSPEEGQPVTCSTGSWLNGPTSFAYTWQRTGASIPGATSSTYTLTSSDVGQAITCTVVAHNASGDSAPAISPPIIPVALPAIAVPIETAPPSIAGTPQAGQTVTCSPGSWTNSPTSFAYTWQRTGATIAGAKSSSYRLTSSDLSQAVTCTVVAHNASGDSAPAISLPILPVGSSTAGGGTGGGTGGSGGTGGNGGTGGTGNPGGSGGRLSAPVLSKFAVKPGRIVVVVAGARQSTKGASFRYLLDKTAGVLFYVQQRLTGRIKGKACVAASTKDRKSKPCSRYVTVATVGVKRAKPGANQLKYSARSGKHALAPGTYRVLAAAANSAGWSKVRTATFTVIDRKVKHPSRPGPRR